MKRLLRSKLILFTWHIPQKHLVQNTRWSIKTFTLAEFDFLITTLQTACDQKKINLRNISMKSHNQNVYNLRRFKESFMKMFLYLCNFCYLFQVFMIFNFYLTTLRTATIKLCINFFLICAMYFCDNFCTCIKISNQKLQSKVAFFGPIQFLFS